VTVPLAVSGEIQPSGTLTGAGLTASGAILSVSAHLPLEGEVVNITIGANNPQGMIAPFGTLTIDTDALHRTLEGQIVPTGTVAGAAITEGCFETEYECVDAEATDFSCIGACETQEPVIVPEILLQGTIIPIGALVQVPTPFQLLQGMIQPTGALSSLKSGFPLDNLMIWLKSYVETPATTGTPARFNELGLWIDQAKPEQNAETFFNGGAVTPQLVPNVINGLPVVKFDSASGFRFLAGHAGMTEGHIFLLIKMDHGIAAGSISGFLSMGCTAPSHYPWADGLVYMNYGTTARKIFPYQAGWGITNWHVLEMRSKAAHWSARINKVGIFSTSVNTFCIPTTGDGAYIGGFPGIAATYEIVELMEFNKVMTDPEANDVVDYLFDVIGA
jgi:hypothetical protein